MQLKYAASKPTTKKDILRETASLSKANLFYNIVKVS